MNKGADTNGRGQHRAQAGVRVESAQLLVDGSNVCYWHLPHGAERIPSLNPLLVLLSELGRLGIPLVCFFDANLRFLLQREEQLIFSDLINSHKSLFGEVPGRTRADDAILMRADRDATRIVSNDQFRGYQKDFPWLRDEFRLIKGLVIGDSLQVTSLGIIANYKPDVNENLNRFLAQFPVTHSSTANEPPPARITKPQGDAPVTRKLAEETNPVEWVEGRPWIQRSTALIVLLVVGLTYFVFQYRDVIAEGLTSLRYGSRVETGPVRERALVALKKVTAYDTAHGVGAKLIDARAALRDAEILYNAGQYRASESLYRKALSSCDELMKFETERISIRKLRAAAEARRREAIRAGAKLQSAETWQQAEEARRTAEAAFGSGDFTQARQVFEQAKNLYEDAANKAAQASPTPEPAATPNGDPGTSPASGGPENPSLLPTRKRIVKEGVQHQNADQ